MQIYLYNINIYFESDLDWFHVEFRVGFDNIHTIYITYQLR
jgi:hypothetical protein